MKSMQSEVLFHRALKVAPGGVHSPVRAFKGVGGIPRFIRSAKGAYLTDVDENRYLDFCLSWGPLIFGHQDEEIRECILGAMTDGWTYGAADPYSLELAELICNAIPWVEKIRFVNSGTEAVMSALRVARAATGRSKILKFEGCYHGHTDAMLVKAGSGLAEMPSPDSAGVTDATAQDTIVISLDDWQAVRSCMERYEKETAVLIIEPIPANNGLLLQREDFLKDLVSLAQKKGILVIFDEVITGFRVGFGGMAQRLGLKPDLVTYGKILGGGFPLGAFGGRRDLMDLVAPVGPVYQAGTLSANPVAVRAGLATLKKILRTEPYSQLENTTESLALQMESVFLKKGIIAKVQRYSSMFWISFGESSSIPRSLKQISPNQKAFYAKLFHRLLNNGIYLAPSGYEISFLSTVHGEEEIDAFLKALHFE